MRNRIISSVALEMATRVSERIEKKRTKQRLQKEQLQVARTFCEDRRDPDGFLEKHVSDYIGKGIFTAKDFKKGDFLLEYRGDLISYSEARKREKEYSVEDGSFMFFFKYKETSMCMDATFEIFSMGRMVNDAARNDPEENCAMTVVVVNGRPHLCLFALRDIATSEELRYDYNDTNLPWRKRPEDETETSTQTPNVNSAYTEPHLPAAEEFTNSMEEATETTPLMVEQEKTFSNFRIIGKHIQRTPEKAVKCQTKSNGAGTITYLVRDNNDKAIGQSPTIASKQIGIYERPEDITETVIPRCELYAEEKSTNSIEDGIERPEDNTDTAISLYKPSSQPPNVTSAFTKTDMLAAEENSANSIEDAKENDPSAMEQEMFSYFRIRGKQIQRTPEKGVKHKTNLKGAGTTTFIVGGKSPNIASRLFGICEKRKLKEKYFFRSKIPAKPIQMEEADNSVDQEEDLVSSGSEYSPETSDRSSDSDSSDALSDIVPNISKFIRNDVSVLPQISQEINNTQTCQTGQVVCQRELYETVQFSQSGSNNSLGTQPDYQESSDKTASSDSQLFVPRTNNIDCRKYDKNFFCLYCEELKSKLPDHLIAKHKEEEEVVKYMEEKNKNEQIKRYIKIRNLGNHLHNSRVLRKREGHLIVRYRPKMYGPCPFCYGYYIRRELWRHKCPLKPSQDEKSKSKLAVASSFLLPQSNMYSSLFQKILCTMKADQISRVAKSDDTIMMLGEKLCNKHGHDNDKFNYVRQKMREMSRLLMELRNSTQLTNNSLASFFHPKYYRQLVACSKTVSDFDESRNRYGTPSLALKIGHSLQKCLHIVVGNCIERRDKQKEMEVEELKRLMDLNWTDDVSSNALKTLHEEKRNRGQFLPLAEDVKTFSEHLKATAEEQYRQINNTKDNEVPIKAWTVLNSVVLAQLILFNRRRSGEISRMKLSDYKAKKNCGTRVPV